MLPELAANKPGMETPDVPLLWVVFPQHCCPSLPRSSGPPAQTSSAQGHSSLLLHSLGWGLCCKPGKPCKISAKSPDSNACFFLVHIKVICLFVIIPSVSSILSLQTASPPCCDPLLGSKHGHRATPHPTALGMSRC